MRIKEFFGQALITWGFLIILASFIFWVWEIISNADSGKLYITGFICIAFGRLLSDYE